MPRAARLTVITMLLLTFCANLDAGPFTHAERKAAEPPMAYSRWHYWAPTLYRWGQHLHPPTIPIYPTDRYPGVPNPTGMAIFPNPAVPTDVYYRGTGLSYDPTRSSLILGESVSGVEGTNKMPPDYGPAR